VFRGRYEGSIGAVWGVVKRKVKKVKMSGVMGLALFAKLTPSLPRRGVSGWAVYERSFMWGRRRAKSFRIKGVSAIGLEIIKKK
jgi:hypothetical protein